MRSRESKVTETESDEDGSRDIYLDMYQLRTHQAYFSRYECFVGAVWREAPPLRDS